MHSRRIIEALDGAGPDQTVIPADVGTRADENVIRFRDEFLEKVAAAAQARRRRSDWSSDVAA